MEKVKIGILGLGNISGIYLKNLTEVSGRWKSREYSISFRKRQRK